MILPILSLLAKAEVIVLLDLIEVLKRKGRHIESGLVEISADSREVCKKLIKKIVKTNNIVQDGRTEIAQIIKLLLSIKLNIKFKLIPGHPKTTSAIQQNESK